MQTTEKELGRFYGSPATEAQWKDAQADAARGYDVDDLYAAISDDGDAIINALKVGALFDAGHIINRHRLITIDRRAEFSLFGKIITQHQGVTA